LAAGQSANLQIHISQSITGGVFMGQLTIIERERLLKAAKAFNFKRQAAVVPAITRADRRERLPLSFAQQRLWFLAQVEGVGESYHIAFGLHLQGKLNRDALRRALDRLLERHEVLRTCFESVDGEPVQKIEKAEASRFELRQEDLRDSRNIGAELKKQMQEEANQKFDLARGPLIRGRLLQQGEDEHTLLITMHHIISDGWSMGVLINEVSLLYTAFHRGEYDPLPPLEVQYADYTVWQRRWLQGEILREQAEYWKNALTGIPELLELPWDYVRPTRQDFSGDSVQVELDEELSAGLKELSRRRGTTLFMTLLAAWGALLSRLSGQADVAIGVAAANRGQTETEGLIGFFVNTQAVRIEMNGSPTVEELLERVKRRALEAQQHQDIPFEQVVELISPTRSLSHSPLFQVGFAWLNTPGGKLELPGLETRFVQVEATKKAKFDMTLALEENEGKITGELEYATSLFQRATVQRYAGYLRALLKGMIGAQEGVRLERIPLQSAEERDQILREWNESESAYPRKCIQELFEEQAEKSPEAVALMCGEQKLTYRELNRRANQLAHYLRQQGVGREERVGICVDRGLEMVVGLLAVLKAGGAYVPLDPGYPEQRLQYMVRDSTPKVVLAQGDTETLFGDLGRELRVLNLKGDGIAWEGMPETNIAAEKLALNSENLAYVMYTSGSTGQPKGVMIEHENVVRLVYNTNFVQLGPADVIAQASNASFDAMTFEVWGALLNGGRISYLSKEDVLAPAALAENIRQRKISTLFLTTALFNQVARNTENAFSGLRYLLFGGEKVDPSMVSRVLANGGVQHLLHVYGPTETTTYATWHEVKSVTEGKTVPIGRPLANTKIYILDKEGQPTPIGVAGELCIGGTGVGRGYVNRPELTSERFVPDLFCSRPGARMYKTGDQARWLAHGHVEFLGRNDNQVKVRGFRIELGEIESRLAEHAGVKEAVLMVREDMPGEKQLVAYYTCVDASNDPGAEELRAHLAVKLPEYMMPALYVRMEEMPLTANGKLDRQALPQPGDAFVQHAYEAPVGEIEEALAAIWSELLRVKRVGRWDNFFELGGHSLLAMKATALVRQRLGLELSIGGLLTHPQLESCAANLVQSRSTDCALPIRQSGTERPLFLVHDGADEIAYAYALAPHVDAKIPVFALPVQQHATARLRTIEGIAQRMVRLIRAAQPAGPYRIGGYSFGAILAYEVATQLIGADEEVELLALFDLQVFGTQAGQSLVESPPVNQTQRTVFLELLSFHVTTWGMPEEVKKEVAGLQHSSRTVDELYYYCKEKGWLPDGWANSPLAHLHRILDRMVEINKDSYFFLVLPLDVHLFVAQGEKLAADSPERMRAMLPGIKLKIVETPGTHWSMLQTPNVQELGKLVSRAIAESSKQKLYGAGKTASLVRMTAEKPSRQEQAEPLFCIPGAGLNTNCFADLVASLQAGRSVHAFKARGLDANAVPHSTIQAAARSYLKELEKESPSGPLHLLGHLQGGWIAFEMALMLHAAGRKEVLLTLLESEPPDEDSNFHLPEYTLNQIVAECLEMIELATGRAPLSLHDLEQETPAAQREILHRLLSESALLPPGATMNALQGFLQTMGTGLRTRYTPQGVYPGTLHLVFASEPGRARDPLRRAKPGAGWEKWASDRMECQCSGNRITMLKWPHLQTLIQLIEGNDGDSRISAGKHFTAMAGNGRRRERS
jgi:amino acid adenylation domain-containing protein